MNPGISPSVCIDPGNESSSSACDKVRGLYKDHGDDVMDADDFKAQQKLKVRGRSGDTFPVKLHAMLTDMENEGLDHVASWQPHGRSFAVRNQKRFAEHVLSKYFSQTKFSSFQRQLNIYGFQRITTGPDKGTYYHELFLKHKQFLSRRVRRVEVRGTGVRQPSSPETEPNLYAFPPLKCQHDTESSLRADSYTKTSSVVDQDYQPTGMMGFEMPCHQASWDTLQSSQSSQWRASLESAKDLSSFFSDDSSVDLVETTPLLQSSEADSMDSEEESAFLPSCEREGTESEEEEFRAILSALMAMPVG